MFVVVVVIIFVVVVVVVAVVVVFGGGLEHLSLNSCMLVRARTLSGIRRGSSVEVYNTA